MADGSNLALTFFLHFVRLVNEHLTRQNSLEPGQNPATSRSIEFWICHLIIIYYSSHENEQAFKKIYMNRCTVCADVTTKRFSLDGSKNCGQWWFRPVMT